MLLPECIKEAKDEGIKAEKLVIHLIKTSQEDLSINKGEATMEWLRKWHQCDIQEKGNLRKDQELIMGDVLYLCRNMSGHVLMGHPDARLETMALVIHSYVLVYIVGKRQ